MSEDRTVLMSVRPDFATALLNGTKTAEVRRRFPELPAGTVIYVYSSTPKKQVVGTLRISAVHRVPRTRAWSLFRRVIGISRPYLDSYLDGVELASIIEVNEPVRWSNPVPLQTLRTSVELEPPQSYRYLSQKHIQQIETLRAEDRLALI